MQTTAPKTGYWLTHLERAYIEHAQCNIMHNSTKVNKRQCKRWEYDTKNATQWILDKYRKTAMRKSVQRTLAFRKSLIFDKVLQKEIGVDREHVKAQTPQARTNNREDQNPTRMATECNTTPQNRIQAPRQQAVQWQGTLRRARQKNASRENIVYKGVNKSNKRRI